MPQCGFEKETKATVWRDEHLQLKGVLAGRLKNPDAVNQVQFIGKGNIIQQDILKGTDVEGNVVMLSGCMLGTFQTNSYTVNEEGYLFEVELIFDKAQISFVSDQQKSVQANSIHFEWYLCGDIDPQFWGSTVRSLRAPNKKVRVGVDIYDEENPDFFDKSTTKDFFLLETAEFTCIVAITGAFRKGSNEKINLFFSLLGLDTGAAEKSAISLRNKMTHSKRDYSKDETVYDDLILTRVYQVLFNRMILKIVGYDGYYIDYSLESAPSKPITMKAGEIN